MTEAESLRRRYAAAEFAAWELHLFLDSHPDDADAARKLKEYREKSARLKETFEAQYGPIGQTFQNTSRWAWVTDPWPWEKEAN